MHTSKTYENHTYKMHTRTTHTHTHTHTHTPHNKATAAQGTPLFWYTAPPVTQLSALSALAPCAVHHAHPKPAKTTHKTH